MYKIEQDYTLEELKTAITIRKRKITESVERLQELEAELQNRKARTLNNIKEQM